MKTTTLFAAVALSFAAAGASMAQEVTFDYPQPITSQKSRAEVIAELQQARADGTLQVDRDIYSPNRTPSMSTLTRAEVNAQTLAAIASGELAALNNEYNDYRVQIQAKSAPMQVVAR